MNRHVVVRSAFALLATAAAVVGLAAPAVAGSILVGPHAELDRANVEVDDRVIVTIDGFEARVVTISVCGNEARRGSADCNMVASKGLRLDGDGTATTAQFGIAAPPVPCPCIVRVASRNADEVSVVPINLSGHPMGEIEDAGPGAAIEDTLAVTFGVDDVTSGFGESLRHELGGPGRYEVTVTVKNRSTVTLTGITVSGDVGRRADEVASSFDFSGLEPLGAGETWEQTIRVDVPAPTFGELHWHGFVTRDGDTLAATETITHRPWLLVGVVLFLVLDIALLVGRWLVHRHARGDADGPSGHPPMDEAPEMELVGVG
ncbi:MAG: hypothetical protein RL238_158 [Actinomycetota bacterium]